jgi:homoserine kinase
MRIRVPATSANIGPGFDSVGIAVNRYLTVGVHEERPEWLVKHDLGPEIPSNEENLLIQTALEVNPDIQPHEIHMVSNIPLTRGLGSSSSVIVAGIELANRLGNMNMTWQDKVRLAVKIEGHPDNVAPAILGDFVLASYVDEEVHAVTHRFPDCSIVGFIPDFELSTKAAREALPAQLVFKDAVAASAIANVMIGAVLNNNLAIAGLMIEQDKFHEAYRNKLVPHLDVIREIGHKHGAYATYLSGAGPTVFVLAPHDLADVIEADMKQIDFSGSVERFEIDRDGVQVF